MNRQELEDIWEEIDLLKEELVRVSHIRETMVKHHAELQQAALYLRAANQTVDNVSREISEVLRGEVLKGGGTE